MDTNVWVSALINPSGPPAAVLNAWAERRFAAVLPAMVLDEIRAVLGRDRLRRRIRVTDEDVTEFVRLVAEGSMVIATTGRVLGCRDKKDDALLEAATLGSADMVVTRDDDLKRDVDLIARMAQGGIAVVSVSTFLRVLG